MPASQGALHAFYEGAARLCARHESLGCLLFAVAATLAIALVERASGATWLAVAPLHVGALGSFAQGNYAVEWLLLALALCAGALLHAELLRAGALGRDRVRAVGGAGRQNGSPALAGGPKAPLTTTTVSDSVCLRLGRCSLRLAAGPGPAASSDSNIRRTRIESCLWLRVSSASWLR